MSQTPTAKSISQLEEELIQGAQKLAEMQRALPPQTVTDYTFHRCDGSEVLLSECFEGKSDLVLVHNMGIKCSYCTMWADGFIGLHPHIRDRAGFVLTSPDPHDVLADFSAPRGWNFPLASVDGTTFIEDVGMMGEGGPNPGVSTFHRDSDGQITKVATEHFGPFDFYCSTWHFLARLRDGVNDWQPKFAYS